MSKLKNCIEVYQPSFFCVCFYDFQDLVHETREQWIEALSLYLGGVEGGRGISKCYYEAYKFGLLIVPYVRVSLSNKALQLYVIVIPQLIISCHVVPVLI